MNDVKVFLFQSETIRSIEINGEPWFVVKDIALILGMSNPREILRTFPESEKGVVTTDTLGGKQKLTIINEPSLYRMIFQSRKPDAEKFKTWVFSEVIPSIRKTRSYALPYSSLDRSKSKEIRNTYTRTLTAHGVDKPHEFIQLTYIHKAELGIPKTKKKDEYTTQELRLTGASELITQFHIEAKNLNGYHQIKPEAKMSAHAVFEATLGLPQQIKNFNEGLEALKA